MRYVEARGMSDGFGIEVDQGVIRVRGDLDAHTAPELDAAVRQVVEEGADVVVLDLSDVDFVDSSGLRSMVLARGEDYQREVVLRSPGSATRRLLEITGLDDQFRTEP